MKILLSLGSNLGWMEANQMLLDIQPQLSEFCDNLRFSSVYKTDGVGRYVGKYANCVAEGTSSLPLDALEHSLKQLELDHGRTSEARRLGIVPIDIDLVRYGDTLVRPKNLEYDYMKPGLMELQAS